MKRVVFLKSHATAQGGLEKYTRVLMHAFVAKGCHVTLLTSGPVFSSKEIEVISLAKRTKLSLYQLIHFDALCKQWLEHNTQDVIFGMERTTYQTHYRAGNGVHAVFLQQRTLIDTWFKQQTFLINPLHRALLHMEKKIFESCDVKTIFTNSIMVQQDILATYSTQKTKIKVVHNGVEWEQWKQPFEETFCKSRHTSYRFLFVGNGYKRKGLPFLLKGLARLKHEDFILTIIGKDKNLSEFSYLTSKLGIEKKVEFLGFKSDLLPFYQQSDALVIPSIYDPFANVTVEALAMGLFVISSQFNGGKEVLNKYSGNLIEELLSPESIAYSLKEALNHPKTESSALKIRNSIKELDFSNQLDKIVRNTLETI